VTIRGVDVAGWRVRSIIASLGPRLLSRGKGRRSGITVLASLPTNAPGPRTCKTRYSWRLVLTTVSQFCQGEFELFQSAEFPPTNGLTQNAESSRSRRFVFSPIHARTYVESVAWREFSKLVRCALRSPPWPQLAPRLSRSLFNRPIWVNNLAGFGPRKRPVAETCGGGLLTRLDPSVEDSHSSRFVRPTR